MDGKSAGKKTKNGFFTRLLEKIDKKMEEKAKTNSCCKGNSGEKKSCCS